MLKQLKEKSHPDRPVKIVTVDGDGKQAIWEVPSRKAEVATTVADNKTSDDGGIASQ